MKHFGWAVCMFGLLMAGCGGGGTEVSGTVTLDGELLPKATVQFQPKKSGRPASGITDANGKYELRYTLKDPGLPPGEYVVLITTATTKTDAEGNEIEVPERVPEKYNTKSELRVKVPAGNYDFDLQSGG